MCLAVTDVRRARGVEADLVAGLLHAFNTEFDTPSPGPAVLAPRLAVQLAGDDVVALVSGDPAEGLAVLSFRRNVWYDAPIAVLDELYVRPDLRGRRVGSGLLEAACALVRRRGGEVLELNVDGEDVDARRFYRARGFTDIEPGANEPMYFLYREL